MKLLYGDIKQLLETIKRGYDRNRNYKIACETEENELIQSQNILNAEMEIESNSKNDDKETSELKIIKSNST